MNRLTRHLARLPIELLRKAYVRALMLSLEERGTREAADVVHRELYALPGEIEGYLKAQATETEILTHRLARRFDLGMALNEAAERATVLIEKTRAEEEAKLASIKDPIARHYAEMRLESTSEDFLTSPQKAALSIQRRVLAGKLRAL